jgi:CelD/BcsL family acetyltransferase involved in cellulose biosynthesis
MDVQVRTDEGALTELAGDWRALWDRDPHASIFHTPEYNQLSWDTELGADRSFAAVECRVAGELVGLATLAIDPDGTLRFLGNSNVTDYLGPLSTLERRDDVAAAVIEGIQRLDGWPTAVMECLPTGSGWPEALARAAKAAGFDVAEARQDVCPRVNIGGSFEAYLASLNGKLRHEIKRKARKLEREAGAYEIRSSTRETLGDDLETFFEMHRASEGHKGKFMHEEMKVFFRRLADVFEQRGWLRLVWLDVAGVPWAATMSFSERGIYNVYNSAFDHTKRELGPGMVLVGETIRLAAEEGCHTYDLLRGDEPYKYRFGAVDEPIVQLTLTRG